MKTNMPGSKEFNHKSIEDYDYLQTAALQDCTGLIPRKPANEAELENYEELYPVLPRLALQNDITYVED